MKDSMSLVVFTVDEQQFAMQLSYVERIVQSVEIQQISMAPDHIIGAVNYHGMFLPVINLRKLFNLSQRDIETTDYFMIAETPKVKMALWIDATDEIITIDSDEIRNADNLMVNSVCIEGLLNLNDGIVLMQDPDKFLTTEQILWFKEALNGKTFQSEKNGIHS
jgi:purine-binding chemotaxis protein CheW